MDLPSKKNLHKLTHCEAMSSQFIFFSQAISIVISMVPYTNLCQTWFSINNLFSLNVQMHNFIFGINFFSPLFASLQSPALPSPWQTVLVSFPLVTASVPCPLFTLLFLFFSFPSPIFLFPPLSNLQCFHFPLSPGDLLFFFFFPPPGDLLLFFFFFLLGGLLPTPRLPAISIPSHHTPGDILPPTRRPTLPPLLVTYSPPLSSGNLHFLPLSFLLPPVSCFASPLSQQSVPSSIFLITPLVLPASEGSIKTNGLRSPANYSIRWKGYLSKLL